MNIKSHCNHLRNRNVIVLFIQKKKKQLPVYLYLFTWPLQHGDDVDATHQRVKAVNEASVYLCLWNTNDPGEPSSTPIRAV